MAFCAKCGVQMAEGASFCGSCGSPVVSAVGGPPAPAVSGASMSSNVAGLLTYILGPITGVVFLLIEPYRQDKFVRFHAFQSIFCGIAWGIAFSVLGLVFSLLMMLTLGIAAIGYLLVVLLFILASFLFFLFLAFKAYSGERFMAPYVGKLAVSAAELPPSASNANGFLAYVLAFITGIIFLTQEPYKNDRFVRFHAFQSIFGSIAFVVIYILWIFLSIFLSFTPVGFLVGLISRIIRLGMLVLWLYMMSKAYNNSYYKLPLVGNLAARQAG